MVAVAAERAVVAVVVVDEEGEEDGDENRHDLQDAYVLEDF